MKLCFGWGVVVRQRFILGLLLLSLSAALTVRGYVPRAPTELSETRPLLSAVEDTGRYLMGPSQFSATNIEHVIRHLSLRAAGGDPRGECAMGVLSEGSFGGVTNLTEAANWYRKAAEHGVAAGQNRLGQFLDHGLGIETNAVEAVKWYTRAAEQGFAPAQVNLGLSMTLGTGTVTNFHEAWRWFQLAANQDYKMGAYWAEMGAKNGDALSLHSWSRLLEEGKASLLSGAL